MLSIKRAFILTLAILSSAQAQTALGADPRVEIGTRMGKLGSDNRSAEYLRGPNPNAIGELDAQPQRLTIGGESYPVPELDKIELHISDDGRISLPELPPFKSVFTDRFAAKTTRNEFVFYSLDPELQNFATELVSRSNAPHVALVAMDPQTGKILAAAGKSPTLRHPVLYAGYPAASIFKLVTAAAAVERAGLQPDTTIGFRGGNYTLNQWNYMPGVGRDSRSMSLEDALAKSCNPVFSRVALGFLNKDVLRSYAFAFGFNNSLASDVTLDTSKAAIPDDGYGLGKAAAGFGEVTLSPMHAATLVASIAHHGLLPRPALVEKIVSPSGALVYQQQPEMLTRVMSPSTAEILLQMMEKTTTIGTSRRAFVGKKGPLLPEISVAAKTGTLRGENPEGINNWFVAAAPIDNPKLALAVIVVHPGGYHIKASQIGRMFIQKFFNEPVTPAIQIASPQKKRATISRRTQTAKSATKKHVVRRKKH
ncbi:MAG: hypothetical protein K1X79_11440 [Oligoflexia bacterium]|nr:hypothetical protein [Oligoflexia bacterium]